MNQVSFYTVVKEDDGGHAIGLNPFMNQVSFYTSNETIDIRLVVQRGLNPFMNQVSFYLFPNEKARLWRTVLIPL